MVKAINFKRTRHSALKWIAAVVVAVLFTTGLTIGLSVRSTVKAIPRLFKRNGELKAQGYYMGEFEFKMLAAQYYLNEGSYVKAYRTLRRIRNEMETTQGLARMSPGAPPDQQMSFLLERQHPTGAFMDSRYPYFTYLAPTENVVEALHALARQTGRPLKLKYSLRFLDQIREPERLRAHLDSLLYLKEPWASIAAGPGPYGPGVSELASFARLEHLGLYQFSDEWEEALRQWFYETQDPATGFWGYRIGHPGNWRQNMDVNSTYHVLKLVLDERGDNQSRKYPLRYAGALARNLLTSLDRPLPTDASKQHDWSLVQAQGARMITRLWGHLSASEKEWARREMVKYLTLRYLHFFRQAEGGFSLYSAARAGDLDGTANALSLLRATGSLPGTWERDLLWGKILAAAPPLVHREVRHWGEAAPPSGTEANSIRVYTVVPPIGDAYHDANLVQILYTGNSPALDVMDLRQCIARFIATSQQAFGNWTSKESLLERPLALQREVRTIPVSRNGLDLARIGRQHPGARRFFVIGYDIFQVPVFKLEFVLTALESQPQAELQRPRVGGAGHLAEIGGPQRCRYAEVREVVRRVVDLRAELQIHALREPEDLLRGDVPVVGAGSGNRVAAKIAERA